MPTACSVFQKLVWLAAMFIEAIGWLRALLENHPDTVKLMKGRRPCFCLRSLAAFALGMIGDEVDPEMAVVGAVLLFLANGALAVLVRWLVEERVEELELTLSSGLALAGVVRHVPSTDRSASR